MEEELAEIQQRARAGKLTRRDFIRRAMSLGLALPVAGALFEACTAAPSSPATATPTTAAASPVARGGGGTLKYLTTFFSDTAFQSLQPHHQASGEMDIVRSIHEPLASIQADGTLVPVLAAQLPTGADIDSNGKFVVWTLKKDVTWHDGKPFTADDVIFTWKFVADPNTGARTAGTVANIASIDKIDDLKLRINFKDPTPLWWLPFTADFGQIVPAHQLSSYIGAGAKTAPYNQKPVGTGPYKFSELRTGDVVIVVINDKYHVAGRPFFDRVEFKNGGGEAQQAARAVIQAGEHDYTINLHVGVDKSLLATLATPTANGRVIEYPGVSSEHIQLNQTDPNKEVDGERSSIKTKHPFFSELPVRQAVALAIDRKVLADELGPRGAKPAVYFAFQNPKYYPSTDQGETKWEYNVAKANQMLDAAGWTKGADGIRAKGGVKMKVLYQTVSSAQRQSVQAVIKKQLEAIGFQVELKSTPSAVYLGIDPANPDNWVHFYADIQEHTVSLDSPDPELTFIKFITSQIPQKANNYTGRNHPRYQNAEVDKLFKDLQAERDAAKRTAIAQKLNEIIAADAVQIPLWHNTGVVAANTKLQGPAPTPWDTHTWNLALWRKG